MGKGRYYLFDKSIEMKTHENVRYELTTDRNDSWLNPIVSSAQHNLSTGAVVKC